MDVDVPTVDIDQALQAQTRDAGWLSSVRFEFGDGASLMAALGTFDLIFADAPGGKTFGLDGTIGALPPGGALVVDDMDLDRHEHEALQRSLADVHRHLVHDERLVCAELSFSSG